MVAVVAAWEEAVTSPVNRDGAWHVDDVHCPVMMQVRDSPDCSAQGAVMELYRLHNRYPPFRGVLQCHPLPGIAICKIGGLSFNLAPQPMHIG